MSDSDSPVHDYERHAAGLLLNEISGKTLYAGEAVPAADFTRFRGNFAEAARGLRAWWEKAKYRIRFDPDSRCWREGS
jgi:hypothetical protein